MSADNYMLIRKSDGVYHVTMEFASNNYVEPLHKAKKGGYYAVFFMLEEAMSYASSEYTEYGIEYIDMDEEYDHICAEIDYNGTHSDLCFTPPIDNEHREVLHACLDEWLNNSEGNGIFYVGNIREFMEDV